MHKSYGAVHAVRGVDLDIPDGEFTVLVGPSGCGKSTLLRTIAGLEDIDSGDIEIGGEIVNHMRPRDRDVAMVFQDYALYPHMTVYGNISLSLRARSMPKPEIEERVKRAAEMLGVANAARPLSAPAVRRPAPARRDRPGHRAQSARLPVRRAAVQPRRAAARRDAQRDQAPPPGDLDDDDLRHARPDRSDDARRPDRAAARRRDRAGGRAARSVRSAGLAVCRRVPRVAADEFCPRELRRRAEDASVKLGDGGTELAIPKERAPDAPNGAESRFSACVRSMCTVRQTSPLPRVMFASRRPIELVQPTGSRTYATFRLGGQPASPSSGRMTPTASASPSRSTST